MTEYQCLTCTDKPKFEKPELITHALDVHHVDLKTTQCVRTATTHIDGVDFYTWTFEWNYDGLKFLETTFDQRGVV